MIWRKWLVFQILVWVEIQAVTQDGNDHTGR